MKEFKIIEEKKPKTYEKIEELLQEKSAEGWEIVSISTDISSDIKGRILIVLQREKTV